MEALEASGNEQPTTGAANVPLDGLQPPPHGVLSEEAVIAIAVACGVVGVVLVAVLVWYLVMKLRPAAKAAELKKTRSMSGDSEASAHVIKAKAATVAPNPERQRLERQASSGACARWCARWSSKP